MTTSTVTPAHVLGRLADEQRLRVLSAIALGATTIREIAGQTDLTEAETARALGQLLRAGIVSQESAGLHVELDAFAKAAREASPERRRPDLGDATPEQALVLRNFVDADGRIATFPARWSKRRVVLEWLAERFEPDRDYAEAEVNDVLTQVNDDCATLRRWLVDGGLLAREAGVYRRVA